MTGIFTLLSVIAILMAYSARKSSQAHAKTIITLTRELADLRQKIVILQLKSSVQPATAAEPHTKQPHIQTDIADSSTSATPQAASITTPASKPLSPAPKTAPASQKIALPIQQTAYIPQAHEPDWFERVIENIQQNWMIWLGGISVGLAGIFMVSHSIRSGYIGPNTQIILALLTGVLLHVGAEYLRRRNLIQPKASPHGTHQVFAALAGGGSITLYAALLTAIHYYQLISPLFAFAALSAVALSTMALSLIHGPVLAILGLTSAYAVPLLTGSEGGSINILLTYILIVTLASLLLTRFVFRLWLWRATLIGATGWWLLAIEAAPVQLSTVAYLAILLWAFIVIPAAQVHQNRNNNDEISIKKINFSSLPLQAGCLIFFAWIMSMAGQQGDAVLQWSWIVLLPVTAFIAAQRPCAWYLVWGAILVEALGWLAYALELTHTGWSLTVLDVSTFGPYLIMSVIISILVGAWFWLKNGPQHTWMSFTLLSPIAWFLLGYLTLGGSVHTDMWSAAALILGVTYGVLTGVFQNNERYRPALVWVILGLHLSYSLAVVFYFSEAALTLAFAFQFISLSVLAKRFELPWLYLILKVVLAIVVTRLTFNPWLATYDIGEHWSLWTYGGSTLFAVIATRIIPAQEPIQRWLEAAALHLFVLFAGAELRYWLYDGDIFASEFSMTEVTINMLLWGSLAITYDIRAQVSTSMSSLYRVFSAVLIGLSALCYVLLLTRFNPWWSGELVSATPIFNILLPAYLGATVLVLAVISRLPNNVSDRIRRNLQWLTGGSFLLFTLLEIRQLWSGADLSLNNPTSEGELYTYSVVGLMYACAAIILSSRYEKPMLYKVGMGLIAVVIAKIFLVDMSGLQGFWRVAAFMGLGFVLLGLAWKYQKSNTTSD